MYVSRRHTVSLAASLADGALTPLAIQIVCVAKRWLALGVIEQPKGSNLGGHVTTLLQLYFGSGWDRAGKPWCTVFAWDVVDEAVKALGGTNVLPGATDTLGNARQTLDKSRSRLKVDIVPAVGSVFFRTSTTPGDGSSGHMGIVVEWDGSTLKTIEGNQGTTDNVGAYSYTAAQLRSYAFEFIHAELIPVRATAPTAECAPTPATPVTPPSPTVPTSTPQSYTSAPRGSVMPSTGITLPTVGASTLIPSSGGSTTNTADLAKKCQQIAFPNLRDLGSVQHYRALENPLVASDITGGKAVDIGKRNGAAVHRVIGDYDENHSSGIGVFTDDNRNLYYVAKEDSPKLAIMDQYSLWGRNKTPYVIPIPRHLGDGQAEMNAEVLMGKREQNHWSSAGATPQQWNAWPQKAVFGKDHALTYKGIPGREFEYIHCMDICNNINSFGHLDRPILIILTGTARTWKDILTDFLQASDFIIATIAPYAAKFGIQPFIQDAQKVLSAVRHLASGGAVDIGMALTYLAPVVESVVPDSLRGPWIQKAGQAYDLIRESYRNPGKLVQAADLIGIDTKALEGTASKLFTESGVADLLAGAKSGLTDIKRMVANVQNYMAVDIARDAIGATSYIETAMVKSQQYISGIPELQRLFVAGAASGVLPVMPNIASLMGRAINKAQDFQLSDLTKGSALEQTAALAMTGLGFSVREETFADIAYQSMYEMLEQAKREAKNAGRVLTSWVLPANTAESKKECYAYLLQESSAENKKIGILIDGQPKAAPIPVGVDLKPNPNLPTTGSGSTGVTVPRGDFTSPSVTNLPVQSPVQALPVQPITTKPTVPTAGAPVRVVDLSPTAETQLLYPRPNIPATDWTSPRADTGITRETPVPQEYMSPVIPTTPGTMPAVPSLPGTQPIEIHPNVPMTPAMPVQPLPGAPVAQPTVPQPAVPQPVVPQPIYRNEESPWIPAEPTTTERTVPPATNETTAPVLRCPAGTHWDPIVHACVPDTQPVSPPPEPDDGDTSTTTQRPKRQRTDDDPERASRRDGCYDDRDEDCGCMDGLATGPSRRGEYY